MTISIKKSGAVPTAFLLRHPAHFIALGFGSGLSTFASGTVGTLVAYPIFLLFPLLDVWTQFVVVAVLFVIGVWACAVTGRALGVVDHGAIVWDEVVAMLLVLMYTPVAWVWYVIAFFVFRAMDIWKPFPIRHADRKIKNGFGVMFDDLLAAIYSIVIIKVLERVIHG